MNTRRSYRCLSGILGVFVVCTIALVPAGAQPGARAVTDPLGRFTVNFPTDWTVIAIDYKTTLLAQGKLPAYVRSMMPEMEHASGVAALGPSSGNEIPAMLLIISMDLPKAIPTNANLEDAYQRVFGTALGNNPDITVTQQGPAKIAKHPGYYAYFTTVSQGQDMYGVLTFFTIGRGMYMAMGATPNDPDRLKSDFATISRILETLQPKAKP